VNLNKQQKQTQRAREIIDAVFVVCDIYDIFGSDKFVTFCMKAELVFPYNYFDEILEQDTSPFLNLTLPRLRRCNPLPYLPNFGYNNYVARRKHGSLSRNIQRELEAALFFQ
jgi:hypothetical protein